MASIPDAVANESRRCRAIRVKAPAVTSKTDRGRHPPNRPGVHREGSQHLPRRLRSAGTNSQCGPQIRIGRGIGAGIGRFRRDRGQCRNTAPTALAASADIIGGVHGVGILLHSNRRN